MSFTENTQMQYTFLRIIHLLALQRVSARRLLKKELVSLLSLFSILYFI